VIERLQGRTEGLSYLGELIALVDVLCDEASVGELAKALVEDTR